MKRIALLIIIFGCIFHHPIFSQTIYPDRFVVSQEGDGDFRTIQEAVNAVRDLSQQQVRIYIRKGIYREKIVVPSWKTNISFIGDGTGQTIITNADYSGKTYTDTVDPFGKKAFTTYNSYTVLVQGNDFTAEGLTIQNTAGRVGQAVALHVEADRVVIKNCRLLGNQDTLYTATENSRQYYLDCYIEGTTDFIFGQATAVFQRCTIHSLSNSYITAASTTPRQAFGFVFLDCKLTADKEATKVYLGRPWRPYAKTVFIRCYMSQHILAQGWDNWRNSANESTAYYAEYRSEGPGANARARVNWSRQLTAEEAAHYEPSKIFNYQDAWHPTNSQ
ncbi:pectinesterase family protein [Olivibacter sp. XZL3]|uniref:pectinesterase family protein n=1 Tax=Olivibacter sp. XZL3 TaxID=1735116 RepID=UPI001065DA7B|nr:pectinesterase family protein [Olivibacter sp. XZL3]